NSLSFNQLKESLINLPESVQQILKKAYVNKDPVNVVFVGSTSMSVNENGWSVITKNELENYYGNDLINISIYEYGGTSTDFLNNNNAKEIIEKNPDIIFLESFRLVDNRRLIPIATTQ